MNQDPQDELLPVVDETGQTIETATRRHCHDGSKLLHPVVHLHLFNSNGDIYLQLRPAWKSIQPGKWDTAVGGHISAGEEAPSALARETYEEIGLSPDSPQLIDTYIFESEVERELVYTYAAVCDDTPTPSTELDGGRFFSPEEIALLLGKGIFTPNFEQEYRRLFIDKTRAEDASMP